MIKILDLIGRVFISGIFLLSGFNKIRNNWSKLDNSNKIVVWKYLNFILKLMDKI